MSDRKLTITTVDGTDAAFAVIVRPGVSEGMVTIEAFANGISKKQAAYILRKVADEFDAEAAEEES